MTFVAAARNRILLVAEIYAPFSARNGLRAALAFIKDEYLPWRGKSAAHAPPLSEKALGYAGSMGSFKSYWSLVHAYSEGVREKGPYPEAQYLRPSLIAQWNFHKGGTNAMSRVLKNIPFHYTGLHSEDRLVIRMIMVQLSNACYLYRMHLTRSYFATEAGRQSKSRILWRQSGSSKMTAGTFLEHLILSSLGRVGESPAATMASSSETWSPCKRSIARERKRHLLNEGEPLERRGGSRGADHISVLRASSKDPKPGQVAGNAGWRMHCSSSSGAPRKKMKSSSSTVPCKSGHKSRHKCSECGVFYAERFVKGIPKRVGIISTHCVDYLLNFQ